MPSTAHTHASYATIQGRRTLLFSERTLATKLSTWFPTTLPIVEPGLCRPPQAGFVEESHFAVDQLPLDNN
jgi:hypothetical protein